MKATPSILQHEFIGLEVKVVRSSNPSCTGICGRVLDETQKTFTILHKEKEKVIVKGTSLFHFTLPDRSVIEVDGKVLVGRPEDRAKKVIRRHW
ncbi:MAG: ribonuclease P protein component 1 [Candidatus Bathyarchaeota archaeon]|nr:ribonuclease P protein component 1 [Candidatus Bathyarchaeota archaeon]